MSSWHGHFGTLMPFYRAWCKLPPPGAPLKEPKAVPVAKASPASRWVAAATVVTAQQDERVYRLVTLAGTCVHACVTCLRLWLKASWSTPAGPV
jgi:hypothetical protein